ncbi:MAG TPA: peptidoglycan bridge formation glycyltransferase FemA/FemB family protein [Patescibacteria group bacterium]|nr:peptidoglycan bridge formation glycyltransferase FemA/FemB family protein [Patescibacteria group bacterium]
MTIKPLSPDEKSMFDSVVNHPLQTYEWGDFREKTGIKVIRRGLFENNKLVNGFQLTIHKIPHTPFTIGYLPKGEKPTPEVLDELYKIGKENNCIFIQLEPNMILNHESGSKNQGKKWKMENGKWKVVPAAHPLFTKYTFVLDLTKSEDELLAGMHSKTRYNIKVARKHNVIIEEDNSDDAFEEYIKLTRETTTRQKFYAHTEQYHRQQWEILPHTNKKNHLSSHLFVAKYNDKILTAWIVFVFKDALYYPYGASSSENREVMASNLMAWEVIRFGKKMGLKTFDMWGALSPEPDTYDPWYGFHNFKQKYGPEHVEFVGSYDLVINHLMYQLYKVADKIRWLILKIKK